MAKNLIEASNFDTAVTVPEGTDSRDDAADAVELLAQALANRTKFLNTVCAKKTEANSFAGDISAPNITAGSILSGNAVQGNSASFGPTSVAALTASSVQSNTTVHANGDITADGDLAGDNVACATVTATGNVSCNDVNAQDVACATVAATGVVTANAVSAAAAVTAATLQSSGNTAVGGSCTVSQDLWIPATRSIKYSGSETDARRVLAVPMVLASGKDAELSAGGHWTRASGTGTGTIRFTLPRLPHGTKLETLQVMLDAIGGGDATVAWQRFHNATWVLGAAVLPTLTTLDSVTALEASPAPGIVTLDAAGALVDRASEYRLQVSGNGTFSVYAARLTVVLKTAGWD